MLKDIQVPAEWTRALKQLHSVGCEDAVIHGGALRDLVLGKVHRVKDLDIGVTKRSAEYTPWPAGWFVDDYMPKPVMESYTSIPGLISVFNCASPYHPTPPIQVCVWDKPVNWFGCRLINNNDFGMNQIAWDGEKFLYTRAFEQDVQTKTFTALKFKVRKQAENSIKRAKNWQYSGDYKGFKFDVSRAHQFLKDNPEVTVEFLDDPDNISF